MSLAPRLWMSAWIGVVVGGGIAHAQDASALVNEADRLIHSAADFDAARPLLDQAEASDGLSHASLLRLYELRALAFPIESEEAAESLRRIAQLDPTHELPANFNPVLQRAFEQARSEVEPLRAEVQVLPLPDEQLALRVRVLPGRSGWVRETRLHIDNEIHTDEEIRVTGDRVTYWLEVIGPGGAVIAEVGRPEAPEVYERDHSIEADERSMTEPPPRTGLKVAAIISSIVLVAVAVFSAAVVVRGTFAERSQPGRPMMR